jgi:hypothetical protein
MPVRTATADLRVEADRNRIALQRGPLVYCVEGADHGNDTIPQLAVHPNASFAPEFRRDLPGGGTVLSGKGLAGGREIDLQAIPSSTWRNRGAKAMKVWLPPAQ